MIRKKEIMEIFKVWETPRVGGRLQPVGKYRHRALIPSLHRKEKERIVQEEDGNIDD